MASITIRNLDEALKRNLRIRAAEHGRSMEEEARDILRQAMSRPAPAADLGLAIHRRFAALGGVDLDLPPREAMPLQSRSDTNHALPARQTKPAQLRMVRGA